MHPQIERFLERPRSHKVAFWIFSFVILGYFYWQFFYAGRAKEWTDLTEKVEALQSRVTEEKRKARDLEKLRVRVKDLDAQLKLALTELPDRKDVAALLNSISTLAKDAGLDVQLFKPSGNENLKEFFAEVPVSISVAGTYHQVASFFDEVGRLPRIVNITDITLREPALSEAGMTVKTDCLATTFRYLDDAERAKMKQVSESGTKRRAKK